ncbi:MAG TPA: site-2 protease family protein [Methylomirabilota bacterium]|nr:site-2 protease family protein [Methylomirabilota bacterium]
MSTPPDDEARRRAENLRAVLAGMRGERPTTNPGPAPSAPPRAESPRSSTGRRTLVGSIGAGIVLLLSKLKFLALLGSVLKLKTLATMLLSIGVYATQWGWGFATGFVILILIHEAGHAVAMRREGIPASAPVFIPFVGAFIAMRGRPRNAYVEAKVALGGPLAGSIAAWATLATGLAFDLPLLVGVGHAAVFLNLFNLIPVSPLDGGRIAGVFTRPFWLVGYAVGIAVTVITRSPILVLVMVVGLYTMWQSARHPVPGYHDVPGAQRLGMGLAYAGLVIALALTLDIGMPTPPPA